MRIELTKSKIDTVHAYAVQIKNKTEGGGPLNEDQVQEIFELAGQVEDFTNALAVAAQSGFAKVEVQ